MAGTDGPGPDEGRLRDEEWDALAAVEGDADETAELSATEVLRDDEARADEAAARGEDLPPPPYPRARFWRALLLLGVVAALPLWTAKYLPMADLPQHAAQLAVLAQLDDPGSPLAADYTVHWDAPYILGTLLALPFADTLGASGALRVLLTLTLFLFPVALRALLKAGGGDPQWSLLGLPLFYGYAFYFGFVPFLVAVPLLLWFVARAWRASLEFTAWRAVQLVVGGVVLYSAHLVALALGLAIAGALLFAHAPDRRRGAARLLLLAPGTLLATGWTLSTATGAGYGEALRLGPLWRRIFELPGAILGAPFDVQASIAGLLLVLVAIACGVRPSARWTRLLPLAIALLAYLATPAELLGTRDLGPRLAVLVGAFALFAFNPSPNLRQCRRGRRAAFAFVVLWSALLVVRFHAFDSEAREYDRIGWGIPPNATVRGLVFERESDAFPGVPLYAHVAAWHQAERGGRFAPAFARTYPQLLRFAPGRGPTAPPYSEFDPAAFSFAAEGGEYDAFIVRSSDDRGRVLFGEALGDTVRLKSRSGRFWLYVKDPSR